MAKVAGVDVAGDGAARSAAGGAAMVTRVELHWTERDGHVFVWLFGARCWVRLPPAPNAAEALLSFAWVAAGPGAHVRCHEVADPDRGTPAMWALVPANVRTLDDVCPTPAAFLDWWRDRATAARSPDAVSRATIRGFFDSEGES